MRFNTEQLKAFTMLEVMITVLVIAMIASFGIPNYQKMRDRTIEEDVINQLKFIHIGQSAYYLQNGSYIPTQTNTATSVQNINNLLRTHIIANGVTYTVTNPTSSTYTVTATKTTSPIWSVTMTQAAWNPLYTNSQAGNPSCVSGCPTLN